MAKKNILLLLLLMIFTKSSFAQVEQSSELYRSILNQDSLLFSVGFNTCDTKQFENLLSAHFKFYHDKDGTSDKVKFIADLKSGICNPKDQRQVKRFLLPESTKIFPLYKNGVLYGAIQYGEHQFLEKRESQAGIAKFTHVWELENGEWKLTNSFSFDHQPYSEKDIKKTFPEDDSVIESLLKQNQIKTLGLGIINGGKLKQVKVFGEISTGVAAPYNTIFNVASLTKPITAIVALRLVSLGKWKLDEPIFNYYTDPDVAHDPRSKKLTTRMILSHQTGFKNWRWLNENKKLAFDFEPGTKYGYSGEGFEYLRKALEKKFKKPLQQLAKELIFEPLKMNDTKYIWDKDVDVTRYAMNFDQNGKAYEIVKNTTANAADDLLTTIEDYGNFLVNLMNEDFIPAQMFIEMASPQIASEKGKHFGLGFERYDLGNGTYALAHGGADLGVRTIVFLLPKTKQGLLIFTNSDTGGQLYEPLVKHYLGEYGQKIIAIETK